MTGSLEAMAESLRGEHNIFVSGSSAEPRGFVHTLQQLAPELGPLHIQHTFLNGINDQPLADASNRLSETTFFPRKNATKIPQRIRRLPISYFAAMQMLAEQEFDSVIVQVSPPDAQGRCSLGPTVEFLPLVLANAKRKLGIINQQVPAIAGSGQILTEEFDLLAEDDSQLATYSAGKIDDTSSQIATHLATLIDDGATLQIGLGKAPAHLCSQITDRRKLRIHSGMISDGFVELHHSGALDADFIHTATLSLGSQNFYKELIGVSNLRIVPVSVTHHPQVHKIDRFIAINSTLEIDLLGQANSEMIGDRVFSSPGGAPDFARCAKYSKGGLSVIALPATSPDGRYSKIVTRLKGPTVTIPRYDIDMVVTEYGIADLRGANPAQVKERLISIAHPDFQRELSA